MRFFGGKITSNPIFTSSQLRELTQKEKIEDFEYMYNILKDNYAHFYEVKKMYRYDWLADKEEFIEKIKSTRNNIEFYNALNDILGKIHDGHTIVLDPAYYKYVLEIAQKDREMERYFKPFIKILKDSEKDYKKWSELLKDTYSGYNEDFSSKFKMRKM